MEIDVVEEQEADQQFQRNFAKIAKISLGLRKFRNHSENFAILAKLINFARHQDFANHCS